MPICTEALLDKNNSDFTVCCVIFLSCIYDLTTR